MNDLIFTTIAKARKETGLSYLGGCNVSQKIIKSQKVDAILTYCIYLAPAKTSGYEVCPNATLECKKGCLATSGRARIELQGGINMIHDCRIKKTKLFFEQQTYFMSWLVAELEMYQRKATKRNLGFAVRLNGTSDIQYEHIYIGGKNIFELFPDVIFYDYTKISSRLSNVLPSNYKLTLSYTGRNVEQCKTHLTNGGNVAMIFNTKVLPKSWNGFNVIDGDITDLRVKDGNGVIAGLKWKYIADKQLDTEVRNSIFCLQANDINCEW